MPNLATLNQTAQEIANALGTIDLELLQKVHDLVTGVIPCTGTCTETATDSPATDTAAS